MPQLGDELATKVESAVDNSDLIDDGVYLVTLDGKVEVKDGKAAPQWIWPFVIGSDQPFATRKVNHRTSLAEAAFYRLKETFAAFGVPTSTDTDELEGKKVRLHIVQKENWQGETGDDGTIRMVNDVKAVLPAEGATGVDEAVKARRAATKKAALEALAAEAAASGVAVGEGLF